MRIEDGDLHLTDLETRIPFRYGIATMTRAPHAFLRLRVQAGGRSFTGISADHLPPRWFEKDPSRSLSDEVARMVRVIEHALELARGRQGDSPFDIWRELYRAQLDWAKAEKLPALLANFGVSLVERALIEAFARAEGRPFAALVRENRLGIRLGELHRPLAGLSPADLLPARPRERIIARHTVGLSDPLRDADIPDGERVEDGLPQSLEACLRAYRLRHLKVKVCGDLPVDLERLARLWDVLEGSGRRDYALTLDGNEQFKSMAAFRSWWEEARARPALAPLMSRLLFVEQPLHRDAALDPVLGRELSGWSTRPRLIIDESDAVLESLEEALSLGYDGTSHKNCKGIFKGLAHACLLEKRRRDEPARASILSGEDLANIGPVALLQDLAVCAVLGVESVERNGHHYFAGLSMFPREVQAQALRAHPDLYAGTAAGWPALRIEEGELRLGSVLEAPFGVGFALDVERFAPLAEWRKKPQGNG